MSYRGAPGGECGAIGTGCPATGEGTGAKFATVRVIDGSCNRQQVVEVDPISSVTAIDDIVAIGCQTRGPAKVEKVVTGNFDRVTRHFGLVALILLIGRLLVVLGLAERILSLRKSVLVVRSLRKVVGAQLIVGLNSLF